MSDWTDRPRRFAFLPFLSLSLQCVCPSLPSCLLSLSSSLLTVFVCVFTRSQASTVRSLPGWSLRGSALQTQGEGAVPGITRASQGRAAGPAGRGRCAVRPPPAIHPEPARRNTSFSSLDGSRILKLAQLSAALLVCFPEQIARGYGG